jgi:hypothetical protein
MKDIRELYEESHVVKLVSKAPGLLVPTLVFDSDLFVRKILSECLSESSKEIDLSTVCNLVEE